MGTKDGGKAYTGHMADVETLCGREVADALAEILGGQNLYIPKSLEGLPEDSLIDKLEPEHAGQVIAHFGGSVIYVSKARRPGPDAREALRLWLTGYRIRDIGLRLQTSERHAYRLLDQERDKAREAQAENLAAVARLHERGMEEHQIARELDLNEAKVRELVMLNGGRAKHTRSIDRCQVLRRHDRGESINAIAKDLKVSPATVKNHLKGAQIARRVAAADPGKRALARHIADSAKSNAGLTHPTGARGPRQSPTTPKPKTPASGPLRASQRHES